MSEARGKYGNKKVEFGGYTFDSYAEMRRYKELCLMHQAGKITDLQVHPGFHLVGSVRLGGRAKPAIRYVADFQYHGNNGEWIVEDVKSPATRKNSVYRLKRHLMKALLGIEVREVEA